MLKKITTTLVLLGTAVLGFSTAQAAVISFNPNVTVSQGTELWWDITSSATSTTGPVGPADFSLTDHGDFHHITSGADMLDVVGASDAGVDLAFGTLIGPTTNFGENTGFTGTTGFGGGCAVGNTCFYGLTFLLSGASHFGWVQFSEGASTQTLIAWGYESTARTAIAAGDTGVRVPEPGTMALLGLGMIGLGAIRRNKK